MDRTQMILFAGGALLAVGLVMAIVLPWFALEDPEDASSAWATGICGGFLVAMLGALFLMTGVFRVYTARHPMEPPPSPAHTAHECPHAPPPRPPEEGPGEVDGSTEGLK